MKLSSSIARRNLALSIAALAALFATLIGDPTPLIVATSATTIYFGWRIGGMTALATFVTAAGVVFLHPSDVSAPGIRLLTFILSTGGVCGLVLIFRTATFYDRVHQSTREIIETLPGLGWSADANGQIRFYNTDGLQYLGKSSEEMNRLQEKDDHAWVQTIHPDDQERSWARWQNSLRTGEPLHDEQRVRRADGNYRWFRDVAVAARDEEGRISGWYGVTTDIHDQRLAEEALRNSERELQLLVDTVPTMIFLMGTTWHPYYYNKRFVEWTGINDDQSLGSTGETPDPHAELIHPDDRDGVSAAFWRAFENGTPIHYRGRLRRKDGEYRWLDCWVEPLRDETGKIIRWYGVNIDVDDQVKALDALRLADERLARASHAASLAELSVSIAHELNSPLQAVVANANAYQRWLNATPPNYERAGLTAERIIRDANAAAEVVNRIRALFAQSGENRAPIDINVLINEVCELVADRLTAVGIRLELALDPHLPNVPGDRVQLEQVVLNLVRNAIEAMDTVPGESRLLTLRSTRKGSSIQVQVVDHGIGIQQPERIFDAFYTTKTAGMGMGLAICRSIVEAHEGQIVASSTPEEGTTVSFTLPYVATA